MGYRSDVGLCLSAKGKEFLDARLAELEAGTGETRLIREVLNSHYKDDEESGAVAWFWECTKWYSEFEDVAFIENLLRNLDDEDFLFVRVGEDDNDAETSGAFWRNPFGMCMVRCISFE